MVRVDDVPRYPDRFTSVTGSVDLFDSACDVGLPTGVENDGLAVSGQMLD